jgi:hypothetical protein
MLNHVGGQRAMREPLERRRQGEHQDRQCTREHESVPRIEPVGQSQPEDAPATQIDGGRHDNRNRDRELDRPTRHHRNVCMNATSAFTSAGLRFLP